MGLIDDTTATTSESNGDNSDNNDMCRHIMTKDDRRAGGDSDGKMGPDDS